MAGSFVKEFKLQNTDAFWDALKSVPLQPDRGHVNLTKEKSSNIYRKDVFLYSWRSKMFVPAAHYGFAVRRIDCSDKEAQQSLDHILDGKSSNASFHIDDMSYGKAGYFVLQQMLPQLKKHYRITEAELAFGVRMERTLYGTATPVVSSDGSLILRECSENHYFICLGWSVPCPLDNWLSTLEQKYAETATLVK